jgi:putative transcriptional regulator
MTTSKDVLEAVAAGNGPNKFLITLGYAGWSAGQLEEEITSNGWMNVP